MIVRRFAIVGMMIALLAAAMPAPPASAEANTLCVLLLSEQRRPALEPVTNLADFANASKAVTMAMTPTLEGIDGSEDVLSNDWLGPHDGLTSLSSPDLEFAFWDHYGVDDRGTPATDDDLQKYWVTGVSQRFGCLASAGCHTIDWPASSVDKVASVVNLFKGLHAIVESSGLETAVESFLRSVGEPGPMADYDLVEPGEGGGC